MLAHWDTIKPIAEKKVLKTDKLKTLCTSIWPTYFIGPNLGTWPPEASLDLDFMNKFADFLATIGRTEEELYLRFFSNLLCHPDIQKACGLTPTLSSKNFPLVTFEKRKKLPKVTEEEEEFPPPYYVASPSPDINAVHSLPCRIRYVQQPLSLIHKLKCHQQHHSCPSQIHKIQHPRQLKRSMQN